MTSTVDQLNASLLCNYDRRPLEYELCFEVQNISSIVQDGFDGSSFRRTLLAETAQLHISSGFDAGGDWLIQFSDLHERIKCYAVVSGGCWLSVEGVADPVRLEAGDCFVLPSGRPFRLGSDMGLSPVDAGTIFPPARAGGVVRVNGGGDFFLVGSRFTVSGHCAHAVLRTLPPIVHIKKESEQAALRWAVERMMLELREPQPGGFLVAQHLAHMMLLQSLRLHLADGVGNQVGWFSALADRQICAAITAMHAEPAYRWTLQELAERAAMSRSAFAMKFKATVGETPMDYLTRWRMTLAADRLENSGDPVSAIAFSLGYESESSFSAAFKRVMGCSPRQYSRNQIRLPLALRAEAKPGRQTAMVSN